MCRPFLALDYAGSQLLCGVTVHVSMWCFSVWAWLGKAARELVMEDSAVAV